IMSSPCGAGTARFGHPSSGRVRSFSSNSGTASSTTARPFLRSGPPQRKQSKTRRRNWRNTWTSTHPNESERNAEPITGANSLRLSLSSLPLAASRSHMSTHVKPHIDCEQHATLSVRDVRAAAEFYANKLGFIVAFTEGEPPTFAGVNLDCVQIFLSK